MPASHLRDGWNILSELPVAVVEGNVWPRLTDAEERGRLKLVSTQTRQLLDQLITSVTLNLQPASAAETGSSSDTAGADAGQQQQENHTAFLTRLPNLTSLTLAGWPCQGDLEAALRRCGCATGGRVTQLRLSGAHLGVASITAVRQACPGLRELHLDRQPHLEGPQRYSVGADNHTGGIHLVGNLFQPLHGMGGLTKLVMPRGSKQKLHIEAAVVPSLGGLTALRHLDLTLSWPWPPPEMGGWGARLSDLLHLGGLVHLRHCSIHLADYDWPRTRGCGTSASLGEVAPLFAATQLTSLQVLTVWHDVEGHQGRCNVPAGADADAMARRSVAAVVQLGGLTCLRSLDLGCVLVVTDTVFSALCRLSQLTELRVRRLQLTAPMPGQLPLLQRLGVYMPVRPDHMLQSLQALLPLPSLVTVTTTSAVPPPHSASAIVIDARCHRLQDSNPQGPDAAEQAAALTSLASLAQHLAAAPCLQCVHPLVFVGAVREAYDAAATLSRAQLQAALQPLAARFSTLRPLFRMEKVTWAW